MRCQGARDLSRVEGEVPDGLEAKVPEDQGVAGPAPRRREETPGFSLGGLSKSAGLPGWKLGWIRVGGPAADRRRIVAALERVADAYLSVSTPVQRALGDVLAVAPLIRQAILDRLHCNLAALEGAFGLLPAVEIHRPEGGWSAVLRVPRLVTDEELALEPSAKPECSSTPATSSTSKPTASWSSRCCQNPEPSSKAHATGWRTWAL